MLAKISLNAFKVTLQEGRNVTFSVVLGFEREGSMLQFVPNESAILQMLKKNSDEIVSLVNSVPRILTSVYSVIHTHSSI